MEKFYLMWVAGKGMPKRVHETIESARQAAEAYKANGGTRECFILGPVERIPGRKLITLKRRSTSEPEGGV